MSNQGASSVPAAPTPLPHSIPAPSAHRPSAQEISKTLIDAADPMEFLRLNRKPPAGGLTPSAPVAPVAPASPENPSASAATVETPTGETPSAPVEDVDQFVSDLMKDLAPKEAAPAATVEPETAPAESASPKDELLDMVRGKKGPEESLKDLRKKVNEKQRLLEEKEAAIAAARAEADKYKSGEVIPDAVKERLSRVEQLEYFEKLHSFKTSREYQENLVKPLENSKTRAAKIAYDYQVDVEVLNQALEFDNERERNTFLKRHFDEVGTLKVSGVLDEIKDLHVRMVEAESQPEVEFERLRVESKEREQHDEVRRLETLRGSSREGWASAIEEITSAGKYPELKITGNPEHDKVSRAILASAAEEFGKTIKLMAQGGMKNLPVEASRILAKRFLMSEAAKVMAESRDHHFRRAEEILENTKRTNSMMRPPVGANTGGQPAGSQGTPRAKSAEDAATRLLAQHGIR